jgi:hypothetical protein
MMAPVEGVVRVTLGDEHFTIGDEIRLTSRIRFPRNDGDRGEFDYRGWLLRTGSRRRCSPTSRSQARRPRLR